MTKALEEVIDEIRTLPEDRQNALAEVLQAAVQPEFMLSSEQLAVLDDSIAQADAGEFMSDADMQGMLEQYKGS